MYTFLILEILQNVLYSSRFWGIGAAEFNRMDREVERLFDSSVYRYTQSN